MCRSKKSVRKENVQDTLRENQNQKVNKQRETNQKISDLRVGIICSLAAVPERYSCWVPEVDMPMFPREAELV